MTKAANDNTELTFTRIGLAAERVIKRLELAEKKHDDEHRDAGSRATDEEREKSEREYVEHRLRELARFERLFDRSFKRRVN